MSVISEASLRLFLEEHYQEVYQRLYRYVRSRLGRLGSLALTVRDALHDAIQQMLDKCPISGTSLTLSGVCGYLARIVRNQTANLRRKLGRRNSAMNSLIQHATEVALRWPLGIALVVSSIYGVQEWIAHESFRYVEPLGQSWAAEMQVQYRSEIPIKYRPELSK